MKPPLRPADEEHRLETLRRYDLLDTLPEPVLDDLTALAARICETPISLISVIDDRRQWFKSRVGLSPSELPRDVSFCGHTILQPDLFIVPDATQDERFADNPLVTGDLHIRFYAGAPLVTSGGHALGTICVMDREPRQLSPVQQEALRMLSRQVMAQLELRRQTRELAESEAKFSAAFHSSPVMLGLATVEGKLVEVNPAFCELTGYSRKEVIGKTFVELGLLSAPERGKLDADIASAGGAVRDVELNFRGRDGNLHHILFSLEEVSLHGAPHRLMTGVDITGRKQAEEKLALQGETLIAVTESLAAYVERGDWREATGRLLRCALSQTQSEYGFVGVVVGTTLRVLAHEGIVWDEIINRDFYELALRTYEDKGYLEFTNFNNLFGRAITTGRVVIANMPDSDPRSGGRPSGHPPMHSFLGVPIFAGQEVQGMMALANRPGGYTGEEQRRIETLVQHSGGLCTTYRQREAALVLEQERLKAETALRESEANLQLALEAAQLGDWSWDIVGGEVLWSARCKALYGLSPDTVMSYGRFLQAVHPEDRDRIDTALKQAVEQRSDYEVEKRIIWPDGSFHWMATRGRVFSDAAGNPIRMAGVTFDITERKLAEQRLRQLNRTYAVLSDINQLIVRERHPKAIFEGACRIAVDKGGFLLAWVGLAGTAGEPLKLAAQAGATPETLAVLDQILGAPESGCAFTLRAVETGGHAVCNDIARDPLAASWRDAALQRGYRAMVALPLTVAGRRAGTFNLYAGEEDFFDAEELRLLDELGLDIAFALEAYERESERQSALARLHASEASKRAVWESALDGIITMDHEGLILDFNPAAERIFGHQRDAVLGRSMADVVIPPAFRERHTRGLEHFLATGEGPILGQHIEVPALRADGSEFPAELTVVVVTGGSQPVFIGTVRDVTDRQRALAELRASDERFRELAETVHEVFWITDPAKNRMLYISPAYEKIWGRTCQSLYDFPSTWTEAIHADDRRRVLHAVHAKQSLGSYDETYRITRPDGSVRWIHDRAFPVHGPAGGVVRVVGTAEDITERRQVEEQFRQSQKMEAIGQLAAGVAHDFNNILAAILGNTQLALADVASVHPARESLEEIKRSSIRATNLVQQILAFSRQQSQERRVVELGPILQESLKFLRATIPAVVELVMSIDAGTPPVLADPTQIHQVVLNLCTNAWHALGDQPGRIEIKLQPVTLDAASAGRFAGLKPGRVACLSVTDTGKGMDAAILERIFDPFFTTKEPGKGTGLGLSVVHGIVQGHDGAISVSSQPGGGATFQVYFPATNAPVPAAAAPVSSPHRGEGQHILYLDDEESLVFLGERMLQRLGYRVTGFTRAADAVQAFRASPGQFDLVITDLNMPGASGLDVAAELLRIRPDVPIVLCSGHVTEELRQRARASGICEVLYKPNTVEEFSEAIHRLATRTSKP